MQLDQQDSPSMLFYERRNYTVLIPTFYATTAAISRLHQGAKRSNDGHIGMYRPISKKQPHVHASDYAHLLKSTDCDLSMQPLHELLCTQYMCILR